MERPPLARAILRRHDSERLLFNWDIPDVRRRYRADSLFYEAELHDIRTPWACFDEIHKHRQWKNVLKGIYDRDGERVRLLVTGSARLDAFRRAGDALAGRYLQFRLSPVALGELLGDDAPPVPPDDPRKWLQQRLHARGAEAGPAPGAEEAFDRLLRFGPFPEPLLKGSDRFAATWRRNYIEAIVHGEMRDLTRVRELDTAEELADMLPRRVGSIFSVNSVREDLDVAHDTVKRMLSHFERLMLTFAIPPHARRIGRPIKKAHKIYLFDWSNIEDQAARFENLVAVELQAWMQLWTDSGDVEWHLRFVRNRAGKETDFLLLRDRKPWCLLECKVRSTGIESHHLAFAGALGGIPVVQLVRGHGILAARGRDVVTVSASRWLA